METTADRLRRLRAERFLSQSDLARASGVGQATIARIELGMAAARPSTVRKLATGLGVEPSAIMDPAELLARSGKDAA